VNGRARAILSRFPAHMEATRDGKRLGGVTEALALDIDTLSAALARVRRARRLLDADEMRDLLRIAALHGISAAELSIALTRFDLARSMLTAAASSDADAERLIALWGIADPAPRLPKFGSRPRVVERARRATNQAALMDALRRRIQAICTNHSHGNGTLRSLIYGAANALDLDVMSIAHSGDRYLHTAAVEDRLRLAFPKTEGTQTVEQEFAPAQERLLIEENPLTPATTGNVARKHGELFSVLRRGFERQTLSVHVTGVENRTVGPMLVNRDEGHGVGFSGAVPSGVTLNFTEEGRVTLDSTDVTSLAYAWKGACFADSTAVRSADRVFAGPGVDPARTARFAESVPAGALGSTFAFPHAGDTLPMAGISVGETRFAFFVQEAHFSSESERVQPRSALGPVDQSVFAQGASEARPTAAVVALSWDERAAFWVNVWIPRRFVAHTPDDAEGRATLGRVAFAVNRFRPAGVQVDVKFQDDRWVLGRGIMLADGTDVIGPGMGTELWSPPKE
jgi:hypothetical protein